MKIHTIGPAWTKTHLKQAKAALRKLHAIRLMEMETDAIFREMGITPLKSHIDEIISKLEKAIARQEKRKARRMQGAR